MKLLLAVLALAQLSAKTYYVDAANGNDASDGLAEAHAWKTLDKVNAAELHDGDRLLFRAGSTFHD